MAETTKIEWTEATWNPITGCSVLSPGCKHCYAMRLAGTRMKHHPSRKGLTQDTKEGPVWTGEVRFNEQWLDQPLRWTPRSIFVCAHGDLFHEKVPDAWIDRIFAVMALCPDMTFQVLTKRHERMRDYMNSRRVRVDRRGFREIIPLDDAISDEMDKFRPGWQALYPAAMGFRWPLTNVWMGVSVEDQQRADQRIPVLLNTVAAHRWVSAEPLLEEVNLFPWLGLPGPGFNKNAIECVVVGGESGPSARPMHPDWVRHILIMCRAAGVGFVFKQWGEWATEAALPLGDITARNPDLGWLREDGFFREGPIPFSSDPPSPAGRPATHHWIKCARVGKKAAGNTLDGKQYLDMPWMRPKEKATA